MGKSDREDGRDYIGKGKEMVRVCKGRGREGELKESYG